MKSEARARLSVNARRALDALICQHFRSEQADNGALQVSHKAFEKAGVHHTLVTKALAELEASGLARVSGKATLCNPWMKAPALYELPTYRPPEGFQAAAKRRFVWIPVEVMESRAWRALSINARRVMDRLLLESFCHMGVDNGKLRVSVRQFAECGVAMRFAKGAIAELESAGLIAVTKGVARGSLVPPNLYRITFHGTLEDDATWTAEKPQQKASAMSEEKFFSHPQKVKRGRPQKVKRETSIHTPKRYSGKAKITPPKGEASIIYSDDREERDCSEGILAFPSSNTPLDPKTARAMRVDAYAIAHANWVRRFGLPTHDAIALMRVCYLLPTTTVEEWAIISAHFTEAIGERKVATGELRQAGAAE